jgi:hypothetical protein
MDKVISSDLLTTYEPELPWNKWIREPEKDNPGEERPKSERLSVEIEWPSIEESSRMAEAGSTTAISLAYAKKCIKSIRNPGVIGIVATNGVELLAIKSKGQRKAWQLALNVGSHIFAQSFLTDDEIKN